MAERRRLVIIQQARRLLDLQACTPVYQLASRSVRIRPSPLGGKIQRDSRGPAERNVGTPGHQCTVTSAGTTCRSRAKSDRHLELARVLPLGRGRVRPRAEAVLLA